MYLVTSASYGRKCTFASCHHASSFPVYPALNITAKYYQYTLYGLLALGCFAFFILGGKLHAVQSS